MQHDYAGMAGKVRQHVRVEFPIPHLVDHHIVLGRPSLEVLMRKDGEMLAQMRVRSRIYVDEDIDCEMPCQIGQKRGVVIGNARAARRQGCEQRHAPARQWVDKCGRSAWQGGSPSRAKSLQGEARGAFPSEQAGALEASFTPPTSKAFVVQHADELLCHGYRLSRVEHRI